MPPEDATRDRLAVVARADLRRLDQERDLNRPLVRDLSQFPNLLEEAGEHEIRRICQAVAGWPAQQSGARPPAYDWAAPAAAPLDGTPRE